MCQLFAFVELRRILTLFSQRPCLEHNFEGHQYIVKKSE